MRTHIAEHSARNLSGPARPKSLFESRLTNAYRRQWASDQAAVLGVAELAVNFLRQADAALSPIIGHASVGALYQRSLYLTRMEHPWLAAACAELRPAEPLLVLKNAVSRQTLGQAQAAMLALVRVFRSLLDNLVGTALTAQLLHPEAAFKH